MKLAEAKKVIAHYRKIEEKVYLGPAVEAAITLDDRIVELEGQRDELRGLILSFISSLTLCEHMGDVTNSVDPMLQKLGITIEWNDFDELAARLDKMNVKTL